LTDYTARPRSNTTTDLEEQRLGTKPDRWVSWLLYTY